MSRRAPLVPLVTALVATFAFAPRAEAVVISREGDQIVVRPDADELLKDVEVTGNGSSFTIAKKYDVGEIGTPHSGPGCDATGAPTCAIGDAKTLRVELGEGDQQAMIKYSPIPVIIDGGPGRDRPSVVGAPSATILGGTGDDIINADVDGPVMIDGGAGDDTIDIAQGEATVTGGEGDDTIRGASRADGGNGNDQLEATIAGARLTGGAGNDTFVTASPRKPTKQSIDCGAGSDSADIDGSDVLGAGCGPSFTHLRKVGTLARFSKDGRIDVNAFLRVRRATSVKLRVAGPRIVGLPKSFSGTYATGMLRLSARAKVSSKLKASSSIRSVLGKRRAAITNATVRVQLFAPGKSTGDNTIVMLPGTLRPM